MTKKAPLVGEGMELAFVRWWVVFSLLAVAIFTALLAGGATFITVNDRTFLSWFVLSLFPLTSIHLGYKVSKEGSDPDLDVTKYLIELCTALGLLGTVIGLMVAIMGAFSNLDAQNPESIKRAISSMSSGIGTSMVTTLVGLTSSILLELQVMVVTGSWRARSKKGTSGV